LVVKSLDFGGKNSIFKSRKKNERRKEGMLLLHQGGGGGGRAFIILTSQRGGSYSLGGRRGRNDNPIIRRGERSNLCKEPHKRGKEGGGGGSVAKIPKRAAPSFGVCFDAIEKDQHE